MGWGWGGKCNWDKGTWVILSPASGVEEQFAVVHRDLQDWSLPPAANPIKNLRASSLRLPLQSLPLERTHERALPQTVFCFQPTDSVCLCYQPTDSLCLSLSSSWPSFYFHPVLTWKCHDLASCVGPLGVVFDIMWTFLSVNVMVWAKLALLNLTWQIRNHLERVREHVRVEIAKGEVQRTQLWKKWLFKKAFPLPEMN